MTAGIDHDRMTHPPGTPPGVLIIRVWTEGDDPEQGLRARLVGRHDVDGEDSPVAAAASIDEVVAETRRWLEQYLANTDPA